MLNRWCGFPVKLSRNRESANIKVLYFVGSDQTKFSACCVSWWKRKKKKQLFLVSRQVLSLKKNHVRLRTDSILQSVFLRFSTCCLHVYSRGLTTTPSLSESCLLSNPVGKTTKTSSSQQVILQMHSICFSFKDMRSAKIWRDEVEAAENLLFTPAVAKNGLVFWNCTGRQRRNLIQTLGII